MKNIVDSLTTMNKEGVTPSNATTAAIDRVADKRHARMCLVMPEQDAAQLVGQYLDRLLSVHKCRVDIVFFIQSLRAAYEVKL